MVVFLPNVFLYSYSMDIIKNIFLLSINAFLWVSTYAYIKYRNGSHAIVTIVILMYTLISLVCYYIFLAPSSRYYFIDNLSLSPFLYLYFMLMITIAPLLHFSPKKISYIQLPSRQILNLLCIIFSLCTISSLITIIPALKTGLVGIILDSSYAADQYADSTYQRMNESKAGGYNLLAILGNIALKITPFLFFCYLLQKRKNPVILTLLIISLLITPLSGIAHASRLAIIASIFLFVFLYIFFMPFFENSLRKKFNKAFIYICVFFGTFFLLISIGRHSRNVSDVPMEYVFARYFAEGPIIFNNYCMDAGGTREGEYVFPFQHILDRRSQYNETELREKFSNLKVDNSRFSTYVGDFVLDFGPLGAAVIFIILSFFLYHASALKKRIVTFPQLILLFFLIKFCGGFYQYQFSMSLGNATLGTLILMYFCFKILSRAYPKYFRYIPKQNTKYKIHKVS